MSAQELEQQRQVHPSQIVDITEGDNKYFLKVFLVDDSINAAKWRIKTESIPKHIEKFVGRPFILTKEHYHPLEFDSVPIDYNDTQGTVNRLLAAQAPYEIGTIRKVERSINPAQAAFGATWNAYVEITDPIAVQAFKSGYTPRYVSASVFRLNQHESPLETTDYEPLHLAAVDNPAYGIHKAGVKGTCSGNLNKCSKQLAQASLTLTELTPEQKQRDAQVLREISNRYSSASTGYSSLVNSEPTQLTINLSTSNAETSQQLQPNVAQSPTGTPSSTNATDNNNNTPQNTTPQQQPQSQPQPIVQPVSGNTAPFEVRKIEPAASIVEQPKPTTANNSTINDMAALMTKYEALLNRVNELETFKQTSLKTEEEKQIAAKRSKIESAIPANYADSPEERTKAVESLMKFSDGPELEYILQKFVAPVATPKPQEGVQKAGLEDNKPSSFMRAKRVTDYATTSTNNKKDSVQQAAVTSNDVDLNRLRRICSMTDIVSNSSNSGGHF